MRWVRKTGLLLLSIFLGASHFGCAGCVEERRCAIVPDILVEPQNVTLKPGEAVSYTAWDVSCRPSSYNGPSPIICVKKSELKEGIIWRSSNPAVAIVDPAGIATAIAAGRTEIGAGWDTKGRMACLTTDNFIPPPHAQLFVYDRSDVFLGAGFDRMPWKVAIHPGKGIALVTLPMANAVQVVNLPSGTLSSFLSVDSFPRGIYVNPTSNRAVVANFFSDTVSVIDLTSSPQVLSSVTLPTGSGPIAATFSPTGGVALVVSYYTGRLSFVDVISPTPQEKAWVGVGPSPTGVAISPTGNAALVLKEQNALTIASLDNVGEVVTVNVSGEAGLQGLAVDMRKGRAILTHYGTPSIPGGSVSILDMMVFPPKLIGTVKTEEGPIDVAVHEGVGITVVVNSGSASSPGNTISLIEEREYRYGGDFTVTSTIPVGNMPTGIALFSGTNLAVVANSGDKSLSLIKLPLP